MKVVFLDFDGVLNSQRYVREHGDGMAIDPSRLSLLRQVIDATGAQIVLSTSWRVHWDQDPARCNETGALINDLFAQYGLQILDKTPQLRTRREQEIKSWLDRHPETENFVVLDDGFLGADFLTGHVVKTSNFFDGLDETDVIAATDILNR